MKSCNDRCGQCDTADQYRQWIGLIDIGDHFIGVDKIVYRNKIEAALEFRPERIFGEEREYGNKRHQKDEKIAHGLSDPRT